MLLGAIAGGLATTNASAMSKSTKKTLTTLQKKEEKLTKTNKLVDRELDKVGVKNLIALMQNSDNGSIPNTLDSNLNTYKLSQATVVSTGGSKTVTLPKGSVIRGSKYTLNPNYASHFSINVENLSKRNQGYVFKKLGKTSPKVNFVLNSKNKTKTYKKSTAFSHNGVQNLPDLSSKNLQSYFDADRSGNPFITITADKYLNYYSNYQTKSGKVNYNKYSQSVKIKRFTRGSSNYTYYLAKPLKGFGTKKVRVGKTHQYRLKVSLGHVFQSYDNYNLDAGGYRMTVKVGSKNFYVDLGDIAESYVNKLRGNSDSYVNATAAQKYINALQQ